MNTWSILRCSVAALATCASLTTLTAASAKAHPVDSRSIGAWEFQSSAKYCTIATTGSPGKLIMMSTDSGANGVLVIPDDQSSISPDHSYPVKINLNTRHGSSDFDMTGSAMNFGGSKVLLIEMKAAAIAAGEPDGFALRVNMNDKVVYDKDMHGSKDAFAAFVGCTTSLTK